MVLVQSNRLLIAIPIVPKHGRRGGCKSLRRTYFANRRGRTRSCRKSAAPRPSTPYRRMPLPCSAPVPAPGGYGQLNFFLGDALLHGRPQALFQGGRRRGWRFRRCGRRTGLRRGGRRRFCRCGCRRRSFPRCFRREARRKPPIGYGLSWIWFHWNAVPAIGCEDPAPRAGAGLCPFAAETRAPARDAGANLGTGVGAVFRRHRRTVPGLFG